jgi:hypothetical protein
MGCLPLLASASAYFSDVDGRLAVLDVDAKAHAGARQNAHAICHRIEIDREGRVLRQGFGQLAFLLPFAGLDLDGDDAAIGGDAVELAV